MTIQFFLFWAKILFIFGSFFDGLKSLKSVLLGREFFTDFTKKLKCLKEKNNTFQSIGFSKPIQLYFLFNFQKISYYCIVISFLSIACLYLPFLFFYIASIHTYQHTLLLYIHIYNVYGWNIHLYTFHSFFIQILCILQGSLQFSVFPHCF